MSREINDFSVVLMPGLSLVRVCQNSLLGDMSFARGRYGTTQVPNLVSHKLIINILGIAKKTFEK